MPTAYFGAVPYTVKPGDTLYGIAHTYSTTVGNILKFNRIPDPNKIRAGQSVIVPLAPPEAVVYTVKQGDTLYSIAMAYGTTVNSLVQYNYLSPPYTIYPGQQLVVTASLSH